MDTWTNSKRRETTLALALWRQPRPAKRGRSTQPSPPISRRERELFFDPGEGCAEFSELTEEDLDEIADRIAAEESGMGEFDRPKRRRFTAEMVRFLEAVNPIEHEENVRFQDEGHKYTLQSTLYPGAKISNVLDAHDERLPPVVSTTVIKARYFQPFRREFIARRLLNGAERAKRVNDPTYRYYKCHTMEDVIARWSTAMYKGTMMHAAFEDLANILEVERRMGTPGEPLFRLDQRRRLLREGTRHSIWVYAQNVENMPELRYFFEFCVRMQMHRAGPSRYVFHRTELSMWNETLHLSGTIDALIRDTREGTYIIADWKRVRGGVKENPKRGKPMSQRSEGSRGLRLPFFKNLLSNSYNEYGFQTTIYRHMFESMTGERVSDLLLVAVDSSIIGDDYALKIHPIPGDMMDEGYAAAAAERAGEMLEAYADTLSEEHKTKLRAYINN